MKEIKKIKILILDDSQARLDIFKKNIEQKLKVLNSTDYAKTAKEAIEFLRANSDYDYIFLDHDLGGLQMEWEEDNCGMNVVDWMVRNHYPKTPSVIVHSWNILRGQEMLKRLQDKGYSVIQHPGVWLNIGA
jgi:CheY-like chemotaxis protein